MADGDIVKMVGTADSMDAAVAMLARLPDPAHRLNEEQLKRAKIAGCTAFRGSRVYVDELLVCGKRTGRRFRPVTMKAIESIARSSRKSSERSDLRTTLRKASTLNSHTTLAASKPWRPRHYRSCVASSRKSHHGGSRARPRKSCARSTSRSSTNFA